MQMEESRGDDNVLRPAVPQRLRLGLPVLMVGNIALLVAANICVGASTEVDGHAPLGALAPHTASSDNLPSAIRRLAEARVWFMVIIVALLSGLLPYLKLLGTLMMVAFTDQGSIGKARGYQGLCVLETIGRYSFADVILICFNAVIFDISTGGEYTIMLFGGLEINMCMQIKFGAVALILAITLSTLLTHWAAFELAPPTPVVPVPGAAEESDPLLTSDQCADSAKDMSTRDSVALSLTTILGLAALIVGADVPMVVIERGGFLGNLIRPHETRDLHLSVFSMTKELFRAAHSRGGGGTTAFFGVCFVALTFVAPLVELLALLTSAVMSVIARRTHASSRRSTRWHRMARQAAEWCHSFGCTEVLLLVCLATLFELHRVVDFNIGDECAPFAALMNNKVLLSIAGLGFAASDSCFEPVSRLRAGWWILLSVVVFRSIGWRLEGRLWSTSVVGKAHSSA